MPVVKVDFDPAVTYRHAEMTGSEIGKRALGFLKDRQLGMNDYRRDTSDPFATGLSTATFGTQGSATVPEELIATERLANVLQTENFFGSNVKGFTVSPVIDSSQHQNFQALGNPIEDCSKTIKRPT